MNPRILGVWGNLEKSFVTQQENPKIFFQAPGIIFSAEMSGEPVVTHTPAQVPRDACGSVGMPVEAGSVAASRFGFFT